MQEREAWYALASAQLGAMATMRLMEAFQHPRAVVAATPGEWARRARLTPAACERLLNAINRDHAASLNALERQGIRMLTLWDEDYPARLRAIPDPPSVLFVNGALAAADARAIAIVGSRKASPYGRHVSAELAAELARRGFTIVSGMALGADAAAHEGCLRAGGRTIAVLGCGVDVVYPPEHLELYERIAAAGAVISENPPGANPTKTSFPIRNRIISGLSLGVVIVEAPDRSGALITADHALEQGREVFAVPGSVNSTQSRGTHRLIRDGARLVESVDDILEELDFELAPPKRRAITPLAGPRWDATTPDADTVPVPEEQTPVVKRPRQRPASPRQEPPAPEPPSPPPACSPEEDAVLRLLATAAKHVDTLVAESGLPPAQVNATLLMLELKGFVQRRPGNQYVRLR